MSETPPDPPPPIDSLPPDPQSIGELTDAQIKNALRKAFDEVRVEVRYVYGPEGFRSLPAKSQRPFWIRGPKRSPDFKRHAIEYSIWLIRFPTVREAAHYVQKPLPPSNERPQATSVLGVDAHQMQVTAQRSYLERPATKKLPERWSSSGCSFRWLLDEKTGVLFSISYWPGNGRPSWADWSAETHVQKRGRFLAATIARVLDQELKRREP